MSNPACYHAFLLRCLFWSALETKTGDYSKCAHNVILSQELYVSQDGIAVLWCGFVNDPQILENNTLRLVINLYAMKLVVIDEHETD